MNNEEKKQIILNEALKLAEFDGWSESTIRKAAGNKDIDEAYCDLLFPRGLIDLFKFYESQLDSAMIAEIKSLPLTEMKIREKIFKAVQIRLELLSEQKLAIKMAAKLLIKPKFSWFAKKMLYNTASKIWYAIGDESTDHNYYTKRIILSAVYGSTLLYWLCDDSEGYQKTMQFLEKRIENALSIGKFKSKIRNLKVINKIPFLRLINFRK